MPENEDAETVAIQAMTAALRPLDELARHRVIDYVSKRLAVELQDTVRAKRRAEFPNEAP